jgi:hypothetical protein
LPICRMWLLFLMVAVYSMDWERGKWGKSAQAARKLAKKEGRLQ